MKPIAPAASRAATEPTLAPEARLLLESGYRLSKLRFLDQFPSTPHIETIAVFER